MCRLFVRPRQPFRRPAAIGRLPEDRPVALAIRLERDPEVEGESIVLDLGVRDEVDSFLENYDRCKEAWVAAIPGLELSSICLVYSLR